MSHLIDIFTLIDIGPIFWAFVCSLEHLIRDHDPILLVTPWILFPNLLIIFKDLFLEYHFSLTVCSLIFQDTFNIIYLILKVFFF